jgi:hypothetical protein
MGQRGARPGASLAAAELPGRRWQVSERPFDRPARRACGQIYVQAESEDHDEKDADLMQGDDSLGCRPAARRATPDVQRACGRATKYPGMGVLRDLSSGNAGLRRT